MRSDFEPIYLQDAKRHIEWLYDKLKQNRNSDTKDAFTKNKQQGLLHRFFSLLKEIF